MKQINLTITALSPLAIGQRKPGGSVSEAMDYIPGTVIRGAVAKAILNHSGQEPTEGDEFHQLFLDEKAAVFRNAYPAIAQHSPKKYVLSEDPVQVVPASAQSSKTKPGFKTAETNAEDDQQGVFDTLIDSYCAKEQGHFYVPNDLKGNLVDTFSGFYSKNGKRHYTHSITKRLLTRVGINRKRATAEDEILYSVEVMDECQGKEDPVQTVYRSSIVVQGSDKLADDLSGFLRSHCTHIRVGGSASRGLGKVQLEVFDLVAIKDTSIEARVKRFNDQLKARWGLWNTLGGAKEGTIESRTFIALTLQADAILDENWRRTTVISPAMLAPILGLEESDILSHIAYTSYDYRAGWNAAWGLPKDTELITKMGGVMLFSIPTAKQAECCNALADIEAVGIGSRCSEGYGQVTVCDEFHNIMREEPV